MEMCATCVHRREEEVADGLFGLDCEYDYSGVLQFDERTGKVTDCEDYEADDNAAERW